MEEGLRDGAEADGVVGVVPEWADGTIEAHLALKLWVSEAY